MENYSKDGSTKDINEILRRHNSELFGYEDADEDEIYDSIVGHTKELLTNRSATEHSGYLQLIQTDSRNSSSLWISFAIYDSYVLYHKLRFRRKNPLHSRAKLQLFLLYP